MFDAIKRLLVGAYLRRFFSKDNLLQPSTWRGIVYALAGLFGMHLSPEVQDQAAQAVVAVFSAGFLVSGAINALRDENKPLPWLKPFDSAAGGGQTKGDDNANRKDEP